MGCTPSSPQAADTPSAEPSNLPGIQEDFAIHLPLTRQPSQRTPPHRQPAAADEKLLVTTEEVQEGSKPPVAFYAKVGLGTPPQQRVLLCDTGSSNTWAAFDSAHDTSWAGLPKDKSFFFTQYGSGFVMGRVGVTTMSIDTKTIGKVYLGAADGQHDTGILGLGFQGLVSGAAQSVLSTWSVPKSIFALSMKRTASGADGQITLGGWDNALLPTGEPQHWVSTIAAAPTADSTSPPSYWIISMAKVEANEPAAETCYYSNTLPANASATILDTGDSLIMLPRSTLESIFPSSKGFMILGFGQAKGQVSLGANALASCPDIKFSFGGQTHILKPAQYVDPLNPGLTMFKESPEPSCFGPAFKGAASVSILGHAFLQNFYTIWDAGATPPRVSFCHHHHDDAA